ncbi:acyl carrier protein [Paenibacillus sp. NPDC058071]|uniref:acyl carrier protein n=1 Tax=Paenibacillus sp. NPDC058071 TaxID=3346326 RepID=UPI0036DBD503
MNVERLLLDLIVQHAAVPIAQEEIVEETDLIQDLGLDSIAIVNLLADLEETFHIEINVQELERPILNRYQWLKEYVLSKLESLPSERSGSV